VFRITPSGTLTTLYTFTGGSDGGFPTGVLAQGTDGNFYGTTFGISGSAANGTVFVITPSGSLTTLYTFTGANDGGKPLGGLTLGNDGNFYGTTNSGGSGGGGTIFQISPAGVLTTIYTFTGAANGSLPQGTLVLASDGSFYGATEGTVFNVTPSGVLTTLHTFTGYPSDGSVPNGGPLPASNGLRYGTTLNGGTSDWGVVYQLSTQPTLSITSPQAQFNYQLTQNNYTETPTIAFSATSGETTSITWSLQLLYATTDGKGAVNSTKTFTTTPGGTKNEHYTGTGGQLTATATQNTATTNVVGFITGTAITICPFGAVGSESPRVPPMLRAPLRGSGLSRQASRTIKANFAWTCASYSECLAGSPLGLQRPSRFAVRRCPQGGGSSGC